jgi:starch phosphorylase
MINAPTFPHLPPRIEGLALLSTNLYWSWSPTARALFRALDGQLWHLTAHNPIALLQRIDPKRLAACAASEGFVERYDAVMDEFERRTAQGGGRFPAEHPDLPGQPVAYFCAEFALHGSVPIYSGGLGVLAGDHCKAASDFGLPLVGVGLLYTRGYFDQRVRLDGWQEDAAEAFDPTATPLVPMFGPNGEPHLATLTVAGRTVHVGAWRMDVGRVPVYLLDTDLESNGPEDRELSHRLYAGGPETRLKQELILGVGGVRVLAALGVRPAAWHANEGHAAFMLMERLRELVASGTSVDEAVALVRASSVFTTHTPVPAGHDVFPGPLVDTVAGDWLADFGDRAEEARRLASHPAHDPGQFHMTVAAIRLSGRVVGVSRRHGEVTRGMWAALWPERPAEAVPIGHITNGVHVGTWMAHYLVELLDRHLGAGWQDRLDDPILWDQVLSLDDAELWNVHGLMKGRLLDQIHEQARLRWRDEWQQSEQLVGAGTMLNARALTIGFARRFATYKRADLIFHDLERLRRLLVNPLRPMQLVFAGKAHPADEGGKQMLQRVYSLARDRRFEGRIAFLEDYELHLAHRLVQGVDLWLNVPRPPMEACGTSGMKAALNGVPQLGTLDGWWAEGFDGRNGWAIPARDAGVDGDAWDAGHLYRLLEDEIVPRYYDRDHRGVPLSWVQFMKHALHTAGRAFTARRMVRQYAAELYVPALRHALERRQTAA